MSIATETTILDAALELRAAGYSVIPIRPDGSKAPAIPWKPYTEQRADEAQLRAWFTDPAGHDIGVVQGAVSGNAELVEIEARAADHFADLKQLAEDSGLAELWARIMGGWLESSPSGGFHFHTVVDGPVPGNLKLARNASGLVLAETRGEGGQVVVAPSRHHASGRPWLRLVGAPATAARLTLAERDAFHTLLRTLDETPPRESAPMPIPPASIAGGLSPLDDFEARTDWTEILLPHGWTLVSTHGRTRYWRRPGKDTPGLSATTGRDPDRDRLYVFSTSTDFEAEVPYTKPGALAVLEHGGDHSATARELRRRGYGTPRDEDHAAAEAADLRALLGEQAVVDELVDMVAGEVDDTTADAAAIVEHIAGHHGQARFAYRLAQVATGRLLHVHGIGWHYWDGTRWAYDDRGIAKRTVLTMLRGEWRRAMNDNHLQHEVKACNTAAGVAGILELAAALEPFAVTVAQLDADPYLLNVANGTLDLRTLQLRPHDPADRLTKVTRAAYDPAATSSQWGSFLARVLPNEQVRGFVHRYAGVALVGKVVEHMLAILTGAGRNGKSTFYGALSHTLGDYAKSAEPDLFMHRENAHPTGEMDLLGVRWVVVSESDPGRRLAEGTVKRLTGGDRIRARRMRQDFVEFAPSHTPALVTNHLPKVRGDDPAIWARLRVIPFDVVIPEAEQDKHLDEKLAADADAVLAWAVAGLADYQRRGGLAEPDAVKVATEQYRLDSDALSRFIADACLTGPHYYATAGDLWTRWTEWARDDGADPGSQRAFGKALEDRGYAADKAGKGQRIRRGIALQAESDDGFDASDRGGW